MISFQSKIFVNDVKGSEIIDFLLNCNDREYQHWWPGTHLALHTIKRCPNNVGNVIYMDEFVGKHRIRMIGIVTQFERRKKIVWQFKEIVRLPVWDDERIAFALRDRRSPSVRELEPHDGQADCLRL